MIKQLYYFIIVIIVMGCSSTKNSEYEQSVNIRPASQAGLFYESNDTLLRNEISSYLSNTKPRTIDNDNFAAIIVPHAGYCYSGKVAASAYAYLNKDKTFKRIFLLGPSHHAWIGGASIPTEYDYYETPLGNVKVDVELCRKIEESDKVFKYIPEAHSQEHCLEVQLPFLQSIWNEVPPIVPILINTDNLNDIRRIAKTLSNYFNEENLFVISSDFSHYPNYKNANIVDNRTCEALLKGKTDDFLRVIHDNSTLGVDSLYTSACGEQAILVLLEMMDSNCSIKHIMYQNSGDTSFGDRKRVVGYHSFAVLRQKAFSLSQEEKKELKEIALKSIKTAFDGKDIDSVNYSDKLNTSCGVFVTLKKYGHLRGCIGHMEEDVPIGMLVAEMARAAAFEDPRFQPLRYNELKDIDIEISVLTPKKRINSIDEFELGKHGLLIKKGFRSGTFLPQVADEVNWTKEEFFGHCSQDKAGLGWNGWKDAELYTYEAIVF